MNPQKAELFGFASEERFRLADQSSSIGERGFIQDVWIRLKTNRAALISFGMVILILLFSLVAPLLSQHRYDRGMIEHQSLPPRWPVLERIGVLDGEGKYQEMGLEDTYYFFGTDTLGRDIWVRTWKGTQVSLYMAFLAVVVDMILGMSFGMISGYYGGVIDLILQRIIEILNSIPTIVIVTLLVFVLKPGILSITLAIIIKGWIGMSKIARAQVLKLKEQEFILASRTLGSSDAKIILHQLLPNIFGQVIIMSMFSIPNAIFTESFLAFIGLGLQPPLASLGVLISEGFKSFLVSGYMVVIPTLVLAVLMFSFTVLADGLRDAFDPKMKEM
ncbi:MAG: ABC transporter permease [Tissierellia bacterium]|nr:ABC transporter permease [Tissierellia bacterium]